MNCHVDLIAQELSLTPRQVEQTVRLLGEGCTIPFISRYRKEATGNLDEVAVGSIRELNERYTELEKRKTSIRSTIEEQGKLTDELRQRIETCYDPARLEDLYLPYKPKRRTRGTVARELGLEPLAALLMRPNGQRPEELARRFVRGEVADTEQALAGASDIIAEWVSENERCRNTVRRLLAKQGVLTSKIIKGKEEEGAKYADYFEWSEPLARCASHRLMAMVRGEKQSFLRLSLQVDADTVLEQLNRIFVKSRSPLVEAAVADGYKRLVKPSIDTELLNEAKERAEEEAIRVFASNLRPLLLASPLGRQRVLALDPGFRTGCKVVCLNEQGDLLHHTTVYPHPPKSDARQAAETIRALTERYRIEAIAVGNGTAGRETEEWLRTISFTALPRIFMVNEDGASVYSASAVAREEFPDEDVTVRGSVSIGRRLMDPLAELVKIDPKSIGVGQYQHDVDQNQLKKSLDGVVESCVNRVGVNLNTASKHLLTYVSGLGPSLAQNVIDYRSANGPFGSRKELLKVPRLGAKAFEQAAGFLRIEEAKNPLDNSAVHPESYSIVEKMAADSGVTVGRFIQDNELRKTINLNRYVTSDVGIPTLSAIMNELSQQGRDPRSENQEFQFAEGISSINDLKEGMILPGIVTNMTSFGVFVDLGVKQDGLVHISQLADRFVRDPAEVVTLRQPVQVKVMEVDLGRNRISLSIKEAAKQAE